MDSLKSDATYKINQEVGYIISVRNINHNRSPINIDELRIGKIIAIQNSANSFIYLIKDNSDKNSNIWVNENKIIQNGAK